ncbi:MAG: class I SAM-dependent methyltransferase [Halorubrum sp.]
MGFHTFDTDQAERLEDPNRYRWVSAEELVGAVDPDDADVVADLGSGTGFHTDAVAPHVATTYAVDIQAEMHEFYREKGTPATVEFVESDVADLPFGSDSLDAAFSTMTYHEFASDAAVAEVARVLRPGARLVVFDWSADGDGEAGPPVDERFGVDDAVTAFEDVGFEVQRATTRTETFVLVALASSCR